jgi:glycosyltransferase involved in cell wall biosynthesis
MKVLYYTATCYLDIAIEIINVLKKEVDLHVLIEITPRSMSGNIINIAKLPKNQSFISPSELLNEENYSYLEPYLTGCASINFIVHKDKTGFSLSTFKLFNSALKYIRKFRPDIIMMEDMSLRQLVLVPFLFTIKKSFIIIHDSLPHSGENNLKVIIPKYLFLNLPFSKSYFFYSIFSKIQFEQHYKKDNYPKHVLRMYSYSFYKIYIKPLAPTNKHILFFGRLSIYKGIEVLLKSVPSVINEFPYELFIIAGKSVQGYNLDDEICKKHPQNISVINRYIPNEELVTLIQESKFVVCPYIDASQSGVLMTAFALNTPVIATKVGAFPEYIEHNVTGMLVPVNDPDELSAAIKFALKDNFYDTMRENISQKNRANEWVNNKDILLKAFISK